ncbi:MAG TPA: hypothetical protein VF932_16370 [Anaerolineae bacterium]
MENKIASSRAALRGIDPARLPYPSKVVALLGSSAQLSPLTLQSFLARTARGERVGVIAGDNRFDAYGLARLARAHRFDPARLLARVEMSRPFTCYQLHRRVVTLERRKPREWSALYVLGLLDSFFDEDVPYGEAARLLSETLAHLKQIAARGLPVLVTFAPPPAQSPRRPLAVSAVRSADAWWYPAPAVLASPALQQLSFALPAAMGR